MQWRAACKAGLHKRSAEAWGHPLRARGAELPLAAFAVAVAAAFQNVRVGVAGRNRPAEVGGGGPTGRRQGGIPPSTLDFLATQHYCCVVLPTFQDDGNLPPGIHPAYWVEFRTRYGGNGHRKRLLSGLLKALKALRSAGCTLVFLDGSFVSAKPIPNDYDGAWSIAGVDLLRLRDSEPVFFDFRSHRAAQKAKFLGELFPAEMQEGASGKPFLSFFQIDKDSGAAKGVVSIDLRSIDDQE